jgi:hypothetical protein
MATRSTIALEFADGTIGQVYSHWDGYLAHNGKMLQEYYSNPFILRDLIDLGSISSLAPTIGTKRPFSHYDTELSLVEFQKQYNDTTTFYGRDRGETNTEARYFKDYEHFLVDGQEEEYDYILRNVNGVATWFVSDHGGDFKLLTEALAEEARELAEIAEVEILPL